MMRDDDNDGQMIFGDLGGLKLPDICLTGEEKPRKNLTQETVPTGDRTRTRWVTGAHAAAWPTAVDRTDKDKHKFLISNYGKSFVTFLCGLTSLILYCLTDRQFVLHNKK